MFCRVFSVFFSVFSVVWPCGTDAPATHNVPPGGRSSKTGGVSGGPRFDGVAVRVLGE